MYLSQTFEIFLLKNDFVMYENVSDLIVFLIVLSFNLYSVRKLILHSGEHAILISRVNGEYFCIKNIVNFAVKA